MAASYIKLEDSPVKETQNNGKCRACLWEEEHLLDWHVTMQLDEELTYAECFHQCTQLPSDDKCTSLPQQLCYNCARQLHNFYDFIQKARHSDLTLRAQATVSNNNSTGISKDFEWVGVQDQTVKLEAPPEEEVDAKCYTEQSSGINETASGVKSELEDNLDDDASDIELKVSPKLVTLSEEEAAEYYMEQTTSTLSPTADEEQLDTYEEADLETNLVDVAGDAIQTEVLEPQEECNDFRDLNITGKYSIYKGRRRMRSGTGITKEPVEPEVNTTRASTQPKELKVVCEYCNKNISKKQYRRHILHEHNKRLLLCHACPRTFTIHRNLRQHILTHQENRERNYSCEHCGRKFLTLHNYQGHIKTHDTNRKRFQCDQCEKSFLYKPGLKLHQQRHSGDTIGCKICHKQYLRRVDLAIHMRSHSGATPYTCPYCDRAFSQLQVMNKHVQVHQGIRYKCDICFKEFTRQASMQKHRRVHTGLPYKCAICDKEYLLKSRLRQHIISAHNELEEVDELIIKIKSKRQYRGRIIED